MGSLKTLRDVTCSFLAVLVIPLWAQGPSVTGAASDQPVDYFRQVRPILSQHCYGCHGFDAAKRKGDLRLDRQKDALRDLGDGMYAIVPGKPDESLLIDRITSHDRRMVMPPAKAKDPLTEDEIETLRNWIAQGAPWPEHWAFTKGTRPSVPEGAGKGWAINAIDHFVASRLAEAGLQPASAASRSALIRRVTYDLTGMPPTPAEIDAFIKDDEDGAYERLVDRLLASARFGERQAQEWLDLARYADTNGYQRDGGRSMWKWREWVIKAFNQNKPFDEFTIEQLAGDLLENPTYEQKIATGFNRNHPTNTEGGQEIDEYRSAYVMDRVNTTATTWLGLTVACAQCHDHKFDPISQKDYYRFYAYFNQVKEQDSGRSPNLRVPNPDQAPHVADLKRRIDDLKKRIEGDDAISDAAQAVWEQKTRAFVGEDVEWQTARPIGMLAHNGSILERQDDGSILASGEPPVRDTYDLVFKPGKRKISAIRIEVLPDPSQPKGSTGRSRRGQFILSGLKMRLSNLSDAQDPPLVFIAKADADLNQTRPRERIPDTITPGSIKDSIIADDPASGTTNEGGRIRGTGRGWSIAGDERLRRHEAILVPLETLKLNAASTFRVTLHQGARPYKSLIGRFRISFTEDERIRDLMLPAVGKIWSAVGPFPAVDVDGAYKTAFEPEKDLAKGMDLKKTFVKPKVEARTSSRGSRGARGGSSSSKPGAKPSGKPGPKPAATRQQKSAEAKPEGSEKPTKAVTSKSSSGKSGGKGSGKFGGKSGGKGSGKFGGKFGSKGTGKFGGKKVSGATEASTGTPQEKKPAGKPSDTRSSKPRSSKPQEKPTATPSSKPSAGSDSGASGSSGRRRQREERLAWKAHREWRDGRPARITATGNEAWYLTRKIHSTRARTVEMSFDGPDGVRVWLNGEVVFEAAPTAASPATRRRGGGGFGGFSGFRGSRGGGSSDRKVRLGMRAGENELVVKAVFRGRTQASSRRRGGSSSGAPAGNPAANANPMIPAGAAAAAAAAGIDIGAVDPAVIANFFQNGGGSSRRGRSSSRTFTFDMTPEGEDVLNHEIVTAIRSLENPVVAKVSTNGEDDDKPTREQVLRKKIRKYYRENIDTVGRIFKAELSKLERELATLERKMPETLIMEEREKKRDTHVFMRGDYRHKADKVEAGVPSFLPQLPKELPNNRLGLAKWLVSGKNPLTARVTVNRVWQQYFGTGLVSTAEDFGVRSEAPSHPELLDYLADEFVRSGWDVKKLHRMIVTSAAYRQASEAGEAALAADPENRLVSRGPRLRLSSEMVRDTALAVSGLLKEEIGGESVRPAQPAGLWEAVARGQRYRKDKGDKQYRRGLYVYWKRGVPYPSAAIFDQAKRELCTVKRAETTTPLQALVLLNDPVYVEAAKMLAQRLLKDTEAGGDDDARLRYGYKLCTSRQLSQRQLRVLKKLLAEEREHFGKDEAAARKLLKVGDAKVDEGLAVGELAAWTSVASALLNLDATLHR